MRKTVKYFEEKLNNYKESLQKVNKRLRFVRKEIRNNQNLTENRKDVLNKSYSKLLKLKEKIERNIVECTSEYNIKWKNRNKRTEKKVKAFDDTQLINETLVLKALKDKFNKNKEIIKEYLENANELKNTNKQSVKKQPYSYNIIEMPYSGVTYYIKDVDPQKYDKEMKHYIFVYTNKEDAKNMKINPISTFVYTVTYNPLNIDVLGKGKLKIPEFINMLKNNYLYPKYNKIIKNSKN